VIFVIINIKEVFTPQPKDVSPLLIKRLIYRQRVDSLEFIIKNDVLPTTAQIMQPFLLKSMIMALATYRLRGRACSPWIRCR
jgi:hypothetical protein